MWITALVPKNCKREFVGWPTLAFFRSNSLAQNDCCLITSVLLSKIIKRSLYSSTLQLNKAKPFFEDVTIVFVVYREQTQHLSWGETSHNQLIIQNWNYRVNIFHLLEYLASPIHQYHKMDFPVIFELSPSLVLVRPQRNSVNNPLSLSLMKIWYQYLTKVLLMLSFKLILLLSKLTWNAPYHAHRIARNYIVYKGK